MLSITTRRKILHVLALLLLISLNISIVFGCKINNLNVEKEFVVRVDRGSTIELDEINLFVEKNSFLNDKNIIIRKYNGIFIKDSPTFNMISDVYEIHIENNSKSLYPMRITFYYDASKIPNGLNEEQLIAIFFDDNNNIYENVNNNLYFQGGYVNKTNGAFTLNSFHDGIWAIGLFKDGSSLLPNQNIYSTEIEMQRGGNYNFIIESSPLEYQESLHLIINSLDNYFKGKMNNEVELDKLIDSYKAELKDIINNSRIEFRIIDFPNYGNHFKTQKEFTIYGDFTPIPEFLFKIIFENIKSDILIEGYEKGLNLIGVFEKFNDSQLLGIVDTTRLGIIWLEDTFKYNKFKDLREFLNVLNEYEKIKKYFNNPNSFINESQVLDLSETDVAAIVSSLMDEIDVDEIENYNSLKTNFDKEAKETISPRRLILLEEEILNNRTHRYKYKILTRNIEVDKIIWNRDDSSGEYGPEISEIQLLYGENFNLKAQVLDKTGRLITTNTLISWYH